MHVRTHAHCSVPSNINDDVLSLYIDSITELDGEQNDYSIYHDYVEVVVIFNVALKVGMYLTVTISHTTIMAFNRIDGIYVVS